MAPKAIKKAMKAFYKVIRKGGGSRASDKVLSTSGTAENISTVTAPKAMGKATKASGKISSKGGEATVTAQLLKQKVTAPKAISSKGEAISTVTAPKAMVKATRASSKISSKGSTAQAISNVLNTVEDPTAWWRRIYDSWVKRGIQESTPLLMYAREKAHYEWVYLPPNPWAHTVGNERMWS